MDVSGVWAWCGFLPFGMQDLPSVKAVCSWGQGEGMTSMFPDIRHRFVNAVATLALATAVGVPAGALADGDDDASGAQLYQENCSVCHGEQGDGDSRARFGLNPPPADFTTSGLKERMSEEEMVQVVTHGKAGTAMAAWGSQLSGSEIRRIVDYVRSEFMRSAVASDDEGAGHSSSSGHEGHDHRHAGSAPEILSASFRGGLEGDFEAGRDLYQENCVACHGREGDGDGPRADFIFPKPRDFSKGAPMSRPALFSSIRDGVRGREMPAWGKIMRPQQLADVAEYVFMRFEEPRILRGLEHGHAGEAASAAADGS